MSIAAIVVALILAFIAWKVLTGILKIGAIVVIVALAIWFVSQGGMA